MGKARRDSEDDGTRATEGGDKMEKRDGGWERAASSGATVLREGGRNNGMERGVSDCHVLFFLFLADGFLAFFFSA